MQRAAAELPRVCVHKAVPCQKSPIQKTYHKGNKEKRPGLRLIIIGNTNPRFRGQEAFEYLMERSRRPLTSWGALDLRFAEETGRGKDLKEAVDLGLRSAKDEINKSLNKLN